MAETRGNFKPNVLLFWILAIQPFWISNNMTDKRGNFKINFNLLFWNLTVNLLWLLDVNKGAILNFSQYGG
jgi:hypothetical protein